MSRTEAESHEGDFCDVLLALVLTCEQQIPNVVSRRNPDSIAKTLTFLLDITVAVFYTRFTLDASRDAQTRQCPKCRQGTWSGNMSSAFRAIIKIMKLGTVAAVVSRNYIKIYKPVILSSRKIWRCTNCSWKAGLNSRCVPHAPVAMLVLRWFCYRTQPPIVARPFSLQAVKEINPMHLVSESWHRPPSIVERLPLSLPPINLVN
ncbi:hypothetical protein CPB85DRAFT_401385 [Mucidula mucida]|nr:hypothetical protein CPB85DRAFT_401385 [Mucidula mucida]